MGRTCAGGLVDGLALCQQDGVQSPVALLGRDEANRAMTVLSVVPVHESGHPRSGLLAKGLRGYCGRYFRVRNSASEYGLSSLTAGRLNEGATPSSRSVASMVAPRMGPPLSL